ncbi:hypothetical protein JV59_25330 (plasmid) [Vibrio coralliilyticus]|nr:hypothetical protein JV59_25330 [Vibrio coralliilyticus]
MLQVLQKFGQIRLPRNVTNNNSKWKKCKKCVVFEFKGIWNHVGKLEVKNERRVKRIAGWAR